VDAVGAHQHVDFDEGPVLELCLDPVALIGKAGQAVADVQAVRGQGGNECSQHVGPVHLVVGRPERSLHGLRKRSAQQRPAVLPPALMDRQRLDAKARQCVG
jgi:hypothetical protein